MLAKNNKKGHLEGPLNEIRLQNRQKISSFVRFQKLISKSMETYKLIFSAEKISRARPSFSGAISVQFRGESSFQRASIEMYRMLLRGKFKPKTTQPSISHQRKVITTSLSGDLIGSPGARVGTFELFLPEYMIELISWTPKSTSATLFSSSLLTQKVIRLTNSEGKSLLMRGETQSGTYDLWHYFYNRDVQTVLPGYIKKKGEEQSSGSRDDRSSSLYCLMDHQVMKEFRLVEVPLQNVLEIKKEGEKWLFDVNVDLIKNLAFERTSGVFLKDDRLLICRSLEKLDGGFLLGTKLSQSQNEMLISKIDKILLIFKNLQHRNVFISPEFDLEDVTIFGDDVYFRGIERLQMRPERAGYDKKIIGILLNKLSELFDKKYKICQNRPLRKIFKTIIESEALFTAKNHPYPLEGLISHFRKNLDLDALRTRNNKHFASEDNKRGKGGLYLGQNSLDLELVEKNSKTFKIDEEESTADERVFDLEILDEGVVENRLAAVMKRRQMAFKNKFFCKK